MSTRSGERDKLKLLIVSSDTFPPTRVDVAVLFGEELARRGHGIDWILQSEAACDRAYVVPWGGGQAWVGPTDLGTSLLHRMRRHLRGVAHDLRLFSRMRRGRYDIIQVKDKFLSGIFAVIAARLHGARFVYWLSYPIPEDYLSRARDGSARYPFLYRIRGGIFSFLLYRVLLRAADHVFVQSEQMRRDVAAEGLPLSRMTAVPMGVKLDTVMLPATDASRSVIPEGQRCFLYLGTLARQRRLDFLVRVLALVRRELPDVQLYVIGRGDHPEDEQLLLDAASALEVQAGLVMLGQLPRAEAFRYVSEADVCVSPFFPTPVLNSTSPTKLVEYMALGKAVVANDHPEQRLVIEESGAGYCVPYEEGAFAAAIVRLLNAPAAAMAMGERGRAYVAANRTYGIIADRVESEFLRIAGATARPL